LNGWNRNVFEVDFAWPVIDEGLHGVLHIRMFLVEVNWRTLHTKNTIL
jgi:hypothetical protein